MPLGRSYMNIFLVSCIHDKRNSTNSAVGNDWVNTIHTVIANCIHGCGPVVVAPGLTILHRPLPQDYKQA